MALYNRSATFPHVSFKNITASSLASGRERNRAKFPYSETANHSVCDFDPNLCGGRFDPTVIKGLEAHLQIDSLKRPSDTFNDVSRLLHRG